MAACRHCGREARERDQFCQYCGHRLDADEVRSEVVQPAIVAAAAGGGHPTPALWRTSTDKLPAVSAQADAPIDEADSSSESAPSSDPQASTGAEAEAEASADENPNPAMPAMPSDAAEPGQPADAQPRSRLLIRRAAAEHGEEREEVLGERDIAVGRSPSCDIVLEGDELASRRHALIQHKAGAYVIVDLGSSNGTYLNGYEVHEATPLRDGDRIAIGSHELIFAIGVPGLNASLAGERPNGLPAMPAAATMHPLEGMSDAERAGAGADAEALPAEAGSAAAGEDSGAMSGAHPAVSRAESKTAPLSAAKPEELEALRLQIADIAGMLAHRADEEARVAQRYHTTLTEVRDQLRELLDRAVVQEQTAAEQRERRTELAGIARDAAAHPRHLDYLAQLSERSGELAELLEAEPQALSDALRAVLAGLNDELD